ncbi:MAG: chitobiase/beta-hexosaminidase C-terminal domain-containing protein [Bacteroidales bacterium]|nr:chitobiase/beta-hexosaminidase C-terminal domain-containing protein [Bacteroidales bacterium]
MRKRIVVFFAATLMGGVCATAQPSLPSRANVVAYYEESAIEKQAYRESPYYMELTGSWQQRQTDSSILYTRQLEAERTWKDYLVYLNVRAGRAVRVLLNDKVIGYGDDSRHWNEFLLSRELRYDRDNKLTIEALKHPKGALLEDTALQVGLNGEPFILFKNDPNVADFSLVADYDASTATGVFSLAAGIYCGKRKGKYYLEVEVWDPKGRSLDRMGRWVVFNGRSEETVDISRSWLNVQPWSAEEPSLYTAVVRLRNDKMEEETVGARFGFRRVEVRDGVLQVNGKAVTLKGVTYGLEHTEGYASRQQMIRDIETMKRHNVNAVRTARYSPMEPYFYELCDRYGLYVVCDANLMPLSTQQMAVATDQDYMPWFEHRVENLYGKYKNYTSIIAWSLGNTRDNGVCMTAAYKRLKAKDKTRPVIFSGADYGDATDVIAPMMPAVGVLQQALKKQGDRPSLMLASVGKNNFSELESLWQLVMNNRQLQGGFVDGWPLSSTMLSELKHLYSPFDVRLEKLMPDDGEFIVQNRNDFANLGRYSLDYNVFTNYTPAITGGALPLVVPSGSSDKVQMRIPRVDLRPGEELFVRFSLTTRCNEMQSWQSSGDLTVGTVEFALPQTAPHRKLENDGIPVLDSAMLDYQLYFDGYQDWIGELAGRMVRHPDERTLCIDDMWRYKSPDGNMMCDVRSTYTRFSTGDVVIDYTIMPNDRAIAGKLRPVVLLPIAGDSIRWFGLDREVLFSGRNSGLVGTFTQSTANAVARKQVRWCATSKGGEGGLFAEVLGKRFDIRVNSARLRIYPQSSDSFRIHLRPYTQQNPSDFYGVSFPRMSMGMLEPPTITGSEVRFSQPLMVTITNSAASEIRYTLDGSEPTESSQRYADPFVISSTTVVKAKAFAKDTPPSFTATRKFNYDYIVRTTFSRKPNTPYNVGADTLLFDGEKGAVDELTHGWLGFSGEPVVTTVQLAKPIDVETVVLRYAHTPATWAFAPRQVSVAVSTDGINYTDTLKVDLPFDPSDEAETPSRVVELKLPVNREGLVSIRIIPQTIATIPSWHRAKGLKPWLLMDEIEIIER